MSSLTEFSAFEELFGPPVMRVDLHWAKLRDEDPEVLLRTTSSLSEIERWHAPWYWDANGAEATYDTTDSPPSTFAQVRRVVEQGGDRERTVRIRDFAENLRALRPSAILVAGYELGGGRCLILDGNHRLAALVAGRVPGWRVALLSVVGPIAPDVLPDLRHFVR